MAIQIPENAKSRIALILTHEKKSQETVSLERVFMTEKVGIGIKNILTKQCDILSIDIYYNKDNTEYQINLIPNEWEGFPDNIWFRYYLPNEEIDVRLWVGLLIYKIESEIKRLVDKYEEDKIGQ